MDDLIDLGPLPTEVVESIAHDSKHDGYNCGRYLHAGGWVEIVESFAKDLDCISSDAGHHVRSPAANEFILNRRGGVRNWHHDSHDMKFDLRIVCWSNRNPTQLVDLHELPLDVTYVTGESAPRPTHSGNFLGPDHNRWIQQNWPYIIELEPGHAYVWNNLRYLHRARPGMNPGRMFARSFLRMPVDTPDTIETTGP